MIGYLCIILHYILWVKWLHIKIVAYHQYLALWKSVPVKNTKHFYGFYINDKLWKNILPFLSFYTFDAITVKFHENFT